MTSNGIPSVNAMIQQQPPKLKGPANYHTLNALHQQLYCNANSFASSLGGANHGYLGAQMSGPKYLEPTAPTNIPFVAPTFPGYLPATIIRTAAYGRLQIHNKDLQKWREYDSVTKALHKQILNAVDSDFIVHLEDEFSIYNNVNVNKLLDYLFMLYTKITSTNLIKSNQTCNQEWDTSRPFQTVLARVKWCCEYAADREQPYTAKQILAKLNTIIFQTSLYHKALEEGGELPANQQMYDDFEKHIIHAQTNLHNNKPANSMDTEWQWNKCRNSQNFGNMVTIDQQEKENRHTHYMLMHSKIAELKAIISKLQQQLPPKPSTQEQFPLVDYGSYCWSHGFCVAPQHTSQICWSKKPGHKDEATWANNLNSLPIRKTQAWQYGVINNSSTNFIKQCCFWKTLDPP
jgi:hypothetical protein